MSISLKLYINYQENRSNRIYCKEIVRIKKTLNLPSPPTVWPRKNCFICKIRKGTRKLRLLKLNLQSSLTIKYNRKQSIILGLPFQRSTYGN